MLVEILLGVFIIASIIEGYVIWNLLKKQERLEDWIEMYTEKIYGAYSEMKLLDDRGVFEKEFFNLDLKTKVPMLRPEGETTYKILVQTSIRNFEGQPIKERKNLNIGFGINPVTVEFGELI